MATVAERPEPEVLEPLKRDLKPRLVPTPVPDAGSGLFSDVLLETDSSERRRRWSALSSVLLQSLMLGLALIIFLMLASKNS